MIYLYVGLAGALGAILRYIIGLVLFTNSAFPYATLLVNLIGSFVLAWFATNVFIKMSLSPLIKTTIGTGFVGSFTTFSTLSVETITMFEKGELLLAITYVSVSVLGGFYLSRLGFKVNTAVHKS
ncbi:CrcB family protein [Neobacillus sp. FSL H8-0543]|uniref:fluoride efflux transporter FluC n=1 Tax=Neobacillus sp. FSL H8-0543 TaxID=2954672 RepID=UPI0031596B16